MFDQAATANTAPAVGDRKAMLTVSGAQNYINDPANKAVAATSGSTILDTVTYTSAAWALDSVAAGTTEYHKVTVRLWLEGEDSTCTNSTFASLNSAYTLGLEFVLGGDETAVTVIGSAVSA